MTTPEFLSMLARSSAQAGALALLVFAAQGIFRRQLSPRWRCALWLLVALRLLVPVSVGSAVSLFNLMPQWRQPATISGSQLGLQIPDTEKNARGDAEAQSQPNVSLPVAESATRAASVPVMEPLPVATTASNPVPPVSSGRAAPINWPILFLGFWLEGVVVLGSYLLLSSIMLARRFRQGRRLVDTNVEIQLREAQLRLGVKSSLPIYECDQLHSPALYGCWRPRLLLPAGFVQKFSSAELGYVFLHELAHVKRRDLPVNWLLTLLQAAHWFNPLVWFAFHRWRADREMACDAMVLAAAGPAHNEAYGRTILRILESFTPRALTPSLVGIIEDKRLLRERIRQIAAFAPTRQWPVLAVALTSVLALVGLTDAQVAAPAVPSAASITPSGTNGTSPTVSPPAVPAPPVSVRAQQEQKQAEARLAAFAGLRSQLAADTGIKLVPIPAGTFMMGSPVDESGPKIGEGPYARGMRVTLTRDFFLGATDVTLGEYEAVMGKSPGGANDSKTAGKDVPVAGIPWVRAMAFCQKLTEQERVAGRLPEGYAFTLPTEAQWEYACRAGTTGPYAGDLDAMAWYAKNSGAAGLSFADAVTHLHPAGTKEPNAWGLYDMQGSVPQWCADWFGNYPGGNVTDPTGPMLDPAVIGAARVVRGGSVLTDASNCDSAFRNHYPPDRSYSLLGFRIALAHLTDAQMADLFSPAVIAQVSYVPRAPSARAGASSGIATPAVATSSAIVSTAIVATVDLAMPGSSQNTATDLPKGLHYAAGPADGAAVALRAAQRPMPGLGNANVDASTLRAKPPLPIYDVTPDAIAQGGGLETAQSFGFEYRIESAGVTAFIAVVREDASTGATRMASVGPVGAIGGLQANVPVLDRGLELLATLDQVRAGSYEARMLRSTGGPQLGMVMLWLKSETGGPDLIYTLDSIPHIFAGDSSSKPTITKGETLSTADEFFKLWRPYLRKQLGYPAQALNWASEGEMNGYFLKQFIAANGNGASRMPAPSMAPDDSMRLMISDPAPATDQKPAITNAYKLDNLELIGIAKHDPPVAFVSPYHGREGANATTRALTDAEAKALDELRTGKEATSLQANQGSGFVIGAIRAQQSCLECHSGTKVGDLLGAFSYRLSAANSNGTQTTAAKDP